MGLIRWLRNVFCPPAPLLESGAYLEDDRERLEETRQALHDIQHIAEAEELIIVERQRQQRERREQ